MKALTIGPLACIVLTAVCTTTAVAYEVNRSSSGAVVKWSVRTVPFVLNSAGGPSGTSSAIQAALSTWTTVSSADFQFTYAGTTSRGADPNDDVNVFKFGYLGTDGTIGKNIALYSSTSGQLYDTDIIFNTYYGWTTTGETGKYDIQNIATHELGHSLSLADLYGSADTEKTLYGWSDPGETKKRTLHSDDIAGLAYLYPFPAPRVTLSITPTSISEAGGVATLTARLSNPYHMPVTVELVVWGTPVWNTDYTLSSGAIVIPAGTTSGTSTIQAIQDTMEEGNETLTIEILRVTNGTSDGMQRGNLVIVDDDIRVYTLRSSAGANGTITPSGTITRTTGETQVYTATPNSTYTVDRWIHNDSTTQWGGVTYTITNIRSDHQIGVVFKLLTYEVEASSGPNGSITPTGSLSVVPGSSVTFHALPDAGFEIDQWLVNGVAQQDQGSTYTLSNVLNPCSVEVRFLAASPIHYVNRDSPNPVFPYASPETASRSIQTAIDATRDGDVVQIAPAHYLLQQVVTITNAITVKGSGPRESVIIDGMNSVQGFSLNSLAGATLEGLCVQNGYAADYGGGVISRGNSTITNCIIRNCTVGYADGTGAKGFGGGMYLSSPVGGPYDVTNRLLNSTVMACRSGQPGGGVVLGAGLCIIDSSLITSNSSSTVGGGGIYCWHAHISNSTITYNTANANVVGGTGGGIQAHSGIIDSCLFMFNSGRQSGGGLYLTSTNVVVRNCVVAHNQVRAPDRVQSSAMGSRGGGISGGIILHCTLSDNIVYSHTNSFGVLRKGEGGGTWNSIVRNSIVTFNSAESGTNIFTTDPSSVAHCIASPLMSGSGNLAADPLFQGREVLNYRLATSSPAIDAGSSAWSVLQDINGLPRPLDGNADGQALPDMGAYETYAGHADSDGDGIPDYWELARGLDLTRNNGTNDSDGDSVSDLAEFMADTDPRDASSLFRIVAIEGESPYWFRYSHSSNRLYSLEWRSGRLGDDWSLLNGQIDVPGGQRWLSDTQSNRGSGLYRIKVSLP